MSAQPDLILSGVVLDAPDPRSLATFYRRLLGWEVVQDEADWVKISPPGGGPGLSFQTEPNYQRPTWPTSPSAPGMMIHLDFQVADLLAACAHAESCGATPAEFQPQDHVRVYFDPVGHPFCLFVR
ncbi:VOC family protein [Crossiella sp. CA198]|uniref:VOC family protein n=1 Tax=Crossiella sp. CA198 TaxID=3455607 RepID=UPI003F8D6542